LAASRRMKPLDWKMLWGREPMNSDWPADVRFEAHYGLKPDIAPCPESATFRLWTAANWLSHSITSSARPTRAIGASIPSAFALFKLIKNSTRVESCTGSSEGFVPFNIRPA
jgi:hypothetical protein